MNEQHMSTCIILNLLSRYLWRKSLLSHSIFFFSRSYTDYLMRVETAQKCWFDNIRKREEKFLILIRCPFCYEHKINACTFAFSSFSIPLNSTFYCFFVSRSFLPHSIASCFYLSHFTAVFFRFLSLIEASKVMVMQ